MQFPKLTLSAALILLALGKSALTLFEPRIVVDDSLLISIREKQDAEGLLAVNEKLKFRNTGIYELELLPAISDKKAIPIEEHREQILKAAYSYRLEKCAKNQLTQNTNCNKKSESPFMLVPRVGKETARLLENYLSLSE